MIKLKVDKVPSGLEDIIGILQNQLNKIQIEPQGDSCCLKMWRFFEENNNPEAVRNLPVNFLEKFEFKRMEGYLGIVIYKESYSENSLPVDIESIAGVDNLAPNGVNCVFIRDNNAEVHYDMFVAFGKSAGALVKAILLTKAFELEALFLKNSNIVLSLYSGICVKSKKITKGEMAELEPSGRKVQTDFLKWLVVSKNNNTAVSLFKQEFISNSNPGKLFMNPFGVTHHKPKVSSLSLKGVQSKLQEKDTINKIADIKELENMGIRDSTRNEIALEFYNEKISELFPSIYVSGDTVARSKEILNSAGITHIFNCAGNVCENYFPYDFKYTKFYIKDSNTYNIESLFYPVYTKIDKILASGGRVLFHCVQGVSRSVALCIGYILFKTESSYEEALSKCKEIRQVCSPNIGFQVQLIWWFKRLRSSFNSLPINPRVFVICSFDKDQPSRIIARLLLQGSNENFILDRRSIFIIHNESVFYIWIGSSICEQNNKIYREVALKYCEYLKAYEKCQEFTQVNDSSEPAELWGMFKERPVVGLNSNWDDWFLDIELINNNVEEMRKSYSSFGSSKNDELGNAKIDTVFEGDDIKLEYGSMKNDNESKYEKVSIRPENMDVESLNSEPEVNDRMEAREEEYKVRLFLYPGVEGISEFDDGIMTDDRLFCLCTLNKTFVWVGKMFKKKLDESKEYVNSVIKLFYVDREIEITWEQAGEETQEFLNYFM